MNLTKIQKRVIHQINAGTMPVNQLFKGQVAAKKLVKSGYLEIKTHGNSTVFIFNNCINEVLDQVYIDGDPEMLGWK